MKNAMEEKEETNFRPLSEKITIKQLEEFLIYDDSFLDYFNEFLKLPVFPQPLFYERLTNSFKILDFHSMVSCDTSAPFIATEKEQALLMDWAQTNRLPLFLKTDLYRELKLSKLLIRPVEEVGNSRQRTFIHGYSKHSEYSSLFSTPTEPLNYIGFSPSGQIDSTKVNEASDKRCDDIDLSSSEKIFNHDFIPYNDFMRPGSEAISLPIKVEAGIGEKQDYSEKYNLTCEFSNVSSKELQNDGRQRSFYSKENDDELLFYKIQTAPLNYDFVEYDILYNNKVFYNKQKVLNFKTKEDDNEMESDSELIEELDRIEDEQKLPLSSLKEIYLGSKDGMLQFREFLKNTAGKHLFDFWLKCEELKDKLDLENEGNCVSLLVDFLRNIKDQFKLNLTKIAKNQISKTLSGITLSNNQNSGLSSGIKLFKQTQYDTLRRLRSYWVPRYLIHKDYELRLMTLSDITDLRMSSVLSNTYSLQSGVHPKLIMGQTFPLFDSYRNILSSNWHDLHTKLEGSVIEFCPVTEKRIESNHSEGIVKRSLFQERLRTALALDTAAGCPFKNYLRRFNLLVQLNCLEFYQEVERFKFITKRNSEKTLRLSHAWTIGKRFIFEKAKENIGFDEEEIVEKLRKMRFNINIFIFDEAVEFSVKKLEREWLRYLKDDLKQFLESSNSLVDPKCPPQSLEEIEVTIEGESIVVRKKPIVNQKPKRVRTWDQLSKEEKHKRRIAALELMRINEMERKQILKTVEMRLKAEKEEKRLKALISMQPREVTKVQSESTFDEQDQQSVTEENVIDEIIVEEKVPNIKHILEKKTFYLLFEKYINDNADASDLEIKNSIKLLSEIAAYLSIKDYDKKAMKAKIDKSSSIVRNYIDKDGKTKVEVTKKILNKIKNENGRPKTPTLREMQHCMHEKLSSRFTEFWKFQLNELKISSKKLESLTDNELATLANKQLPVINNAKRKNEATAILTNQDRKEFEIALDEISYCKLTLKMLHFFKYLLKNGLSEHKNGLEKDLLFCIEIKKLYEICKTSVDEDITKKKLQSILNVFLESSCSPAVQINIPSEIAVRLVKQCHRQMSNKEVDYQIFEDGYQRCIKNLLPQWAGFQQYWREISDPLYRPLSRYRELLERRVKIYSDIPIPKAELINLPILPKNTNLTTLSYTMNEGVKWKQI